MRMQCPRPWGSLLKSTSLVLFGIATLLVAADCNHLCAQDSRSSDHGEGLRENRPVDYAIVNAKIVTEPGKVLDKGTIIVRGGKIVRVGETGTPLPADLKVVDLAGKTVYPGLIDAFSEVDVDTAQVEAGASYWNAYIRPQLSVAKQFKVDEALNQSMRKQGFTARLVVPSGGILKGSSAFVLNSDESVKQAVLQDNVAQHGRLTVSRRFGGSGTRPSYPNSPMGAVALARQALYDADWYGKALLAVNGDSSLPRPDRNDALAALQALITGDQQIIIDSSNELYFLRADRFAREFGISAILHGSGLEYRRLDAIAKTGRAVILPVDFPSAPNVSSFETSLNVSLETLMEWELGPENPARLSKAGIEIAFGSEGLDDVKDFLKNIRIAVKRGLSSDDALRALTVTPAKLLNVDDQVGTIQTGKLANLVVTDGELFDERTKIVETWVNGVRHQMKTPPTFDVEGDWSITTTSPKKQSLKLDLVLSGTDSSVKGSIRLAEGKKKNPKQEKTEKKPAKGNKKGRQKKDKGSKNSEQDGSADDSIKLKKAGIQNARFSATFDATSFGSKGIAQLTFVFDQGDTNSASGYLTWPDGTRVPVSVSPAPEKEDDKKTDVDKKDSKKKNAKSGLKSSDDSASDDSKKQSKDGPLTVNYPLGAFGVQTVPDVETVFIHNVTVWTCGDQGVLKNAAVLIRDGKIVDVGVDLKVPKSKDVIVIDGTGHHVTPGIIDCHSHIASDGGINESGQAITAEVRIGDFVNCDDMNIYRQLAGGVTTSNILHGSANPIGGQNQVIKLRWGMLDEEMKFAEAPQGIKFALGENVKRSRSSDSTRYPRTRMGVEQIFMDEFRAAKGYQQEWKRWKTTRKGLPPRRDLELDAIAEILDGKRWIHCHSYRQDEILALIRLLDGFGIQIGTFQHILEGYKVADEMKKHGAMGSAFADWWAYKFEVYDAIPYAGALMHNAGVVVSFNSDDRELARHLNHEAAKAVKYGGVPPEEALKFVTLNPAKQLRIEKYVGSIEKGKHADIVLWSGDPLSTMSRCEKTWVDGRRMFDRSSDQQRREHFSKMKQRLVQKVLASGEKQNSFAGGRPAKPSEMWPNYDEFCRCKGKK